VEKEKKCPDERVYIYMLSFTHSFYNYIFSLFSLDFLRICRPPSVYINDARRSLRLSYYLLILFFSSVFFFT